MRKMIMAMPSLIAAGVAALPVLTCPACWPLYAGALSALGLGFIDYTPFLLPLTAAMLVVATMALAWRGRQRWGYGPLLFGAVGAALILLGKFWMDNQPVYYVGIAVLLAASGWNIWPVPETSKSCCQGERLCRTSVREDSEQRTGDGR